MIVRNADKRTRELQPDVEHTVLSHHKHLMLCEVSLAQGVTFPAHAHPHVQIVYIVSGSVTFTRDGETFDLEAGESCLIEPNQTHSLIAKEDTLVIDAFTPRRDDFLAQE